MKIQTAPTDSFTERAPFFNYRISMDTKGPINPPSEQKHTFMSKLTLLGTLLLPSQSNQTMPKPQLKFYYTIGLPNMVHLFTLLVIVDPNT